MLLYFLLGLLPEIFVFYYFTISVKELKEKRFATFIGFLLVYVIANLFFIHTVYFNIICLFGFCFVIKLLHKERAKVTDIFLLSFVSLAMILLGCLTYFTLGKYNYMLSMIFNRILTIMLIFTCKYVKNVYKIFLKCWNRNRENPNKIRSLTLRNISIITFNVMIFIINQLLQIVLNK